MASEVVYLERFTRTERAVHWVHATAFFELLATGLVLYVPRLSILVGRRPLLKNLHVYTAVAWLAALVLVVVLGDRRRLRRTVRELEEFDRRRPELASTAAGSAGPLQRRPEAQRRAHCVVCAALRRVRIAALARRARPPLPVREHDPAARLADVFSLVLLVGHLYLALIYPATRHSLRGITSGSVRSDWAERHHAKWVREQRQ